MPTMRAAFAFDSCPGFGDVRPGAAHAVPGVPFWRPMRREAARYHGSVGQTPASEPEPIMTDDAVRTITTGKQLQQKLARHEAA